MKISSSTEFFHYQGASYKVLLDVFKDLISTTRDFAFLDIGCGKGRAVLVAEYCGYNKLRGIDLDQELISDANENLANYKFKRRESEIVFSCENALTFLYPNEASVYFLFNPFNEAILSEVLRRLCTMNENELVFVYMNPLYPGPFLEMGMEPARTYKTSRYTEAVVFRRNKISL